MASNPAWISGRRTKPRLAAPARLIAVVLAITAIAFLGADARRAAATVEGDISYTVFQSPPAGSVVQVGASLAFRIDVQPGGPAGGFPGPLTFDLRKPPQFSYASFGLQAGNIVTSCTDNLPSMGYVRCIVGSGGSVSSVGNSSTSEIVLSFVADPGAAGTLFPDATMQALFTDPGTGFRNANDSADNVGGGGGENDQIDGSVGGIVVPNIGGANANISIVTTASPAVVFEGNTTTITVGFTHSLGAIGASLQPVDVSVTNADIQAGSVACPGGTGTPSVVAGVARCSGSVVADGNVMTFAARARDTAAGDDIAIAVSAPSLGLPPAEAAALPAGWATQTVTVEEVGLETVALPGPTAAAPPWALNLPLAVCTATAASDVADDRAGGSAQAPAAVAGTSTLASLTPLASADFSVTGPAGSVAFTYLDSTTAGCGSNQSGVRFTPTVGGSYVVTAKYNGDLASSATRTATLGSNSLAIGVQATSPAPVLSSIAPTTSAAGAPGFSLTITGSGFTPSSIVRWNGTARVTTFVSSTSLSAAILAADVATTGSASVTVFTPTPGGGTSSAATFTIGSAPNPAPVMGTITPIAAPAGSPGFTLTINGSGFASGAKARWNGTDRPTTYISSTQLTAEIGAGDVMSAGSATIQVFNPAPGGGTSLAATFTVNPASTTPVVTALAPASVTAGVSAFNLSVTGTGFVSGAQVQWNGSARTTTFVSPTSLTASITAADVAVAGAADVTVMLPSGGAVSAAIVFTVQPSGLTVSDQLLVLTPPAGTSIPRSRLTFSAVRGTLAVPTSVTFVIRRASDGKYWSDASSSWEVAVSENAATVDAGGTWRYTVAGAGRRLFVGTKVSVEARATISSQAYAGAVVAQIEIR